MKPSIWIYGGVHYDPGSRLKFVGELAKQETAPRFVAVEWEESVYEVFAARRPWIADRVKECWDFLKVEDRHELSLAFAWEADAHKKYFPDAELLWLEAGFQESNFEKRYKTDLVNIADSFADSLVQRLCNPCRPTLKEWIADIDPPADPKSKEELINRVWRTAWEGASEEKNYERDQRWADAIIRQCSGLNGGWAAVVVGWAHADPAARDQTLRNLLNSGFFVNSMCLGP